MTGTIRIEMLDVEEMREPARFFAKERIRIGRHEANDLCFSGERARYVSSFHAEIYVAEATLYINDVGSQNGTLINGIEIDHPTPLKPGDVLQIGKKGPSILANLDTESSAIDAPITSIEEGTKSDLPPKPQEERQAPLSDSPKRMVGEATLRRVVYEAVSTERTRNRKVLVALIGVGLLLAPFIVYLSTSLLHPEETATLSENDAKGVAPITAAATSTAHTSWADVVEHSQHSIFLCYGNSPSSNIQALGTAFAIDARGILATNAHVVELLQRLPVRLVVQNDTGKVFKIKRMLTHPDYKGGSGPDVGLIEIETHGSIIPAVDLATEKELRQLRVGTQLGTLGFPAELQQTYLASLDRTNDVAPGLEATFKEGWIGRIVNAAGARAEFADSIRIQHSASLSGGTSGSPMFTSDGHVVAINHSGLDYAVVTSSDTSTEKNVERILNPAEIGHALRIDVLERFKKDSGW